jgi:hypothetical protein
MEKQIMPNIKPATLTKPCNQCLFSKNKIVSDEVKAEIVADCLKTDKPFVCHKTNGIICKGFDLRYQSQAQRMAKRLGIWKEYNLEEIRDKGK